MRKIRPWEFVFYLSLVTLLFWLILKLTGVINTPVLIEYGIPITSVLFGFFALYRDMMAQIHKVSRVLTKIVTKINYMEKDIEELKQK